MSDWMVDAGRTDWIRKTLKALPLPISFPQELRRPEGPWSSEPLGGRTGAVVKAGRGGLDLDLTGLLERGGATLAGDEAAVDLVFIDATGVTDTASLRDVYSKGQPMVRRLKRNGRVVFVTRSLSEVSDASAVAAVGGVEGIMRSLARELGRKGITVNQLAVTERAVDRLAVPLYYVAGDRSAFFTGQLLEISHSVRAPAEHELAGSLAGKVALVTGAARGIGASIAAALAGEGAHVVCLDRADDSGDLAAVAEGISGTALEMDVTDSKTPSKLAKWLEKEMGGVDIVIHNAGVTRDRTFGRMTDEEWDLVLAVNLEAILKIQDALVGKVLNSYGRVIVLSSVTGLAGNAGQTNYAATKSALRTWVAAAAPSLVRRGITVNAISPGFIETQMTAAVPAVNREFGRRLSALQQGGTPEDVAELAVFLSHPGAHGVTGENPRICGGMFFGA